MAGLGSILDKVMVTGLGNASKTDVLYALENEIAALGAMGAKGKKMLAQSLLNTALKNRSNNKQANKLVATTMSKGMKILLSTVGQGKMDIDFVRNLEAGNIKVELGHIYRRMAFATTPTGTITVWDQSNEQRRGRSNVDKSFLPQNNNLVVTHLDIKYGQVPPVVAPLTINSVVGSGVYTNAIVPGGILPQMPPEWRNSEFEMAINSETVISLPLSRFTKVNGLSIQQGLNPLAESVELDTPFMLKQLAQFKDFLYVPDELSFSNAYLPDGYLHAIEINKYGLLTSPSAKS